MQENNTVVLTGVMGLLWLYFLLRSTMTWQLDMMVISGVLGLSHSLAFFGEVTGLIGDTHG